jgi:hypothetical protein
MNEGIDPKEFHALSERVARAEERLELGERIARLEEQQKAANAAVPLVAEPLRVEARALQGRMAALETAKNESTGKSSGFSASWGILLGAVTLALLVAGLVIAVVKGH